jgi:hypothetical protein
MRFFPSPDEVGRPGRNVNEVRLQQLRNRIAAELRRQTPTAEHHAHVNVSGWSGPEIARVRQDLQRERWESMPRFENSGSPDGPKSLEIWPVVVPTFPGQLPTPAEADLTVSTAITPAVAELLNVVDAQLRQPTSTGQHRVLVNGYKPAVIAKVTSHLQARGWSVHRESDYREDELVITRAR